MLVVSNPMEKDPRAKKVQEVFREGLNVQM
jgi:hypothetical protein